MSQTDTDTDRGEESAIGNERTGPRIGREYATRALTSARAALESGVPAGIGGGASLLRGVRALRRGDRRRGFVRLGLGGLLGAVALAQRRSSGERDRTGVDQTDVANTGPDIGGLEGRDSSGDRHASGDAARRVVDSSVDIEDADSSPELDSDVDASTVDRTDVVESGIDEGQLSDVTNESGTAEGEPDGVEREAYERLGAAAFDEHSGDVPVPQEAFNRNVLSLNSEVFWGIRDDDAVFVSQQFDPMQDRDGIRYVASTEIDGDRTLTIPDAVVNHWESVAGGGIAVAGGDEIAFVTADSLRADGQLRVVPEQWIDDVLEDGE